jgi:hypothetical protein
LDNQKYNSRKLAEKSGGSERGSRRDFRETDPERGDGSESPEARRSPSRAGSSGGESVDTTTRKKREREHWTKKMLKDPKLAKQEGLEDDYEYLVKWDGENDPDNPQ